MKHTFILLATALMLMSCGDLKNRLDDLEGRVESLEKQCERMNQNLTSMQAIVDVLNNADFIKSVTPLKSDGRTIGYKLEFLKSPAITIYNGTDGKDGADGKDAPVIGISKDGGIYYWTLGGDWLLDADGNRIRVNGQDGRDGVTPQLKIEDGTWWISYDDGANWSRIGDEAPVPVLEVREDANYVYITLASGTEVRLPKVGSVIAFEDPRVKLICVKHWDTNKDGELSYDEAAAVTSLGDCFQDMDILYFNELQYFTGLSEIEPYAFCRSGIQETVLPKSIRSIGMRAFFGTALKGISVPETVESIDTAAFYACRSLEYANIPQSFTEIPPLLFAGCWSLKEIAIPAGTTKIGSQAFHECFELADVNLPATLDTIEHQAFARCKAFTEVVLPESVRSIGYSCFYECEKAARIVMPDHISMLDHMAVYGCHAMESFTVPSAVDTIGWFTFWSCSSLHELIMKPAVPPVVRTDNSGAHTLFKDCPEDLVIRVPDVAVYEGDPYWSRYTGMYEPMKQD